MGEHIYTCDCVRMGKRCVVANRNSTHKDRVSLFTFPKNAKLRATWNRQIKSTRADWHNEVPNSTHMEKEGLVRGIKYITDKNLQVKLLTDMAKYLNG